MCIHTFKFFLHLIGILLLLLFLEAKRLITKPKNTLEPVIFLSELSSNIKKIER
jgi:hypothetical protein